MVCRVMRQILASPFGNIRWLGYIAASQRNVYVDELVQQPYQVGAG